MLTNYARILRRSAAVTAAAAAVMVALSTAVGGGKGALGALLGTAIVTAFFAISVIAVGAAARATYAVKILLLLLFVARFSNSTAFNPRLFGLSAIVCILAWSASQVTWSLRLKIAYVVPDGER